MKIEDMLMTESHTVQDVIERLESVRCKVVYVVNNKKLLASVTDGDIRRFLLKAGDMSQNISKVANYEPVSFKEYEKANWRRLFKRTEMYSAPIVNFNDEIVGIVYRNGTVIRGYEKLEVPVVMMAGGKGTRLYPYTKILPKALVPIGEIPIAEHIINRFYQRGCKEFFMIVNHKKGMIQSYFDNIDREYVIEYKEEQLPLGTGGGLSLLKDVVEQDFILTNCDIIIDADYAAIYNQHKEKGNFITIVLSEYKHIIPYGVVDIDEDNNYNGMIEKSNYTCLVNTGLYIVNSRVINELSENMVIGFPDIIEKYRNAGEKIGCYVVNELAYMDMGQLEVLEKTRERLRL
ncbi:MAG: CBS domain-containing protein [Lachnospiraceae bacterium]|nr:CBS domain-containing protein [Lachnospiraceae bacterium]